MQDEITLGTSDVELDITIESGGVVNIGVRVMDPHTLFYSDVLLSSEETEKLALFLSGLL